MSREAILRVIADRGDGTWQLPSAIEGLAAPHTPRLYFHDVPDSVLAPWLVRFGVELTPFVRTTPASANLPATSVTEYHGALHSTPVEIVHYREAL